MKQNREKVDGIGLVEHPSKIQFHTWEYAYQNQINSFEELECFIDKKETNKNECNHFFIDYELIKNKFSYVYLKYLESIGINVTKFSKDEYYGTYALDLFSNNDVFGKIIIRFSKIFNDNFLILSKKPEKFDRKKLNSRGFKNMYTSSQVLCICRRIEDNYYKWDEPIVFPDGIHCTTPLTSTDQYAQSCFEGIVAMSGKLENEMIILRPEDNAKRLRLSARSIAIPPISEEAFMKSLEHCLKANKDYMPKSNEEFKIYIRPYIKGLDGGYGVGPANNYIFCVQIFPYGDFVGGKDSSVNLISLEGKRRSHDGGIGSLKVSGNYAQTILDREKVRKKYFNNKFYNDIFYFGDEKKILNVNGEKITVLNEVIDEDAAGNLIFFKLIEGELTLFTPPLNRNSFLGGFTRDTVLEIGKTLGSKIIEKELSFQDLAIFDGAFLTGSAVGISKISKMTYKEEEIAFYESEKSLQIFEKFYNMLYSLRRGNALKEDLNKLIHSFNID